MVTTTTVLTSAVRNNLALSILGSGYGAATPKYIQWGTGSAAALGTDETISDPLNNRVTATGTITTTTTSGDTLLVQGTLTSSGSQKITNLGLFTVQSSTATGTITTQLNPGATTVVITGYNNFPSTFPFDVQMLSEVMTVVTGNGTNSWTVTRATNGSPISTNVIPAGTRIVGGNNTANGTMFLKTSFGAGVALNAGDALQFKISLQFI